LCIRSDHGTEFKAELDAWCKQYGVHREYSAVEIPQQNGRAERANRDMIEGTRALLMQRKCPPRFWPFAMETKAYIKNRVPAAGRTLSPMQAMFPNRGPDLSQLRVFGCRASLYISKSKRGGKLNPVSVSGVFVGYSPHTKGWRVAIGNTVQVSPCVSFHEDMDGDCSVVPSEHSTDSNSEEEYDEYVATGLPLSPHTTPAGPAPADQVPNVIADIEPAAANVDQTADAPPEIAAPRRSERVRAMPHRYEPGTAFVTERDEYRHIDSTQPSPSWVEGNAFAVGGEDAPKSYADIANLGDLKSRMV
jgi:hypothetical protein